MSRRATLCLVFLTAGCAVPADSSEIGKCRYYEAVLSDLAERCGGHRLAPSVLGCDQVLFSDATGEDLTRCHAWAVGVQCNEFIEKGLPDVCKISFRHVL